jgi:hypothetical protein
MQIKNILCTVKLDCDHLGHLQVRVWIARLFRSQNCFCRRTSCAKPDASKEFPLMNYIPRFCFVAFALLLGPVVAIQATSLSFKDKTPKDSPCDTFEKAQWEQFREALTEVLGDKAGVVKAINDQLDGIYKKESLTPKDPGVEIYVVSEKEFLKERGEDLAGEKEDIEKRSKKLWDKYDAYTYPTKDKKIKVKIFCKPGIVAEINGNKVRFGLYRLIIHEFVHAKLEAMRLAGLKETPFDEADKDPPDKHKEDHNPKFHKQVEELLKKLLKNLGLK